MREATNAIGIPDSTSLTVHDFEVRTFPERRQDILELLIELWEEWQPDAVFMPSVNDIHQDHQVVAAEGLRAFKRTTVLGYEIPWNNLNFSYQAYVSLEKHAPRAQGRRARAATSRSSTATTRTRSTSGPAPARTASTSARDYAEVFEVYRVVA